jgi:hypothetical protein
MRRSGRSHALLRAYEPPHNTRHQQDNHGEHGRQDGDPQDEPLVVGVHGVRAPVAEGCFSRRQPRRVVARSCIWRSIALRAACAFSKRTSSSTDGDDPASTLRFTTSIAASTSDEAASYRSQSLAQPEPWVSSFSIGSGSANAGPTTEKGPALARVPWWLRSSPSQDELHLFGQLGPY